MPHVPSKRERSSREVYPQDRRDDRESKEAERRAVVRTWLILLGMMVTFSLWFGLIYLLEPGIR